MKSKYELTISTGYVPKWTYIEAVRELFQNAIDNEAVNSENKMSVCYADDKLLIANKTSKLTLDSLLLGSSTKRDDERTIGQHGEGYKIAFMVLLREGKSVTVYNYGANEIWTTKIVNSRRYNGAQVIQIEVEKNPMWKKVPDKDLTIEIGGISSEEWENIKECNLFLRDEFNASEMTNSGRVLLDSADAGKIFVKGLYVCNSKDTKYGYDFHTNGIKLDRDRQLVDSFNIAWYASQIWCDLSKDSKYTDTIASMITDELPDVRFISSVNSSNLSCVAKSVLDSLRRVHGSTVYPVSSNLKYSAAKKAGYTPIIVSEYIERIVSATNELDDMPENEINLLEKIKAFRDKVEHKLSDEEIKEFNEIVALLEEEL